MWPIIVRASAGTVWTTRAAGRTAKPRCDMDSSASQPSLCARLGLCSAPCGTVFSFSTACLGPRPSSLLALEQGRQTRFRRPSLSLTASPGHLTAPNRARRHRGFYLRHERERPCCFFSVLLSRISSVNVARGGRAVAHLRWASGARQASRLSAKLRATISQRRRLGRTYTQNLAGLKRTPPTNAIGISLYTNATPWPSIWFCGEASSRVAVKYERV